MILVAGVVFARVRLEKIITGCQFKRLMENGIEVERRNRVGMSGSVEFTGNIAEPTHHAGGAPNIRWRAISRADQNFQRSVLPRLNIFSEMMILDRNGNEQKHER